ncbi:MAG: hypothetical protein CVU48_01855 [Candidatus Cloacimonetes bacterium HGW-Cloacimonetes-1]|jgi:hypothetical protein|nr:MAG: hypothetical protein CVU48_01855 [Candidatus Cloacimonetes bacterium HGW-Cloacimonetes-1]
MKRLSIILIMLAALGICFAAEYHIVLTWDEMEGELNGVLTGVIAGNSASVSGVAASSAMDGKFRSLGETMALGSVQRFDINVTEGYFSFWIRDKFVDDDINPDGDLIRRSQPKIEVFRGTKLLRGFSIEKGNGLTCKVFSLDAASGAIDPEIRFYPRTKMILAMVVDALNGKPVPDATVEISGGEERFPSFATDSMGYAAFPVEIGAYNMNISLPGYIRTSFPVEMNFDENPHEYVIALAPETREYRIVLTWGSRPADLDAHLLGPTPEGSSFHIWYRNRVLIGGKDFLDRDKTTGYGPETITIYKPAIGEYLYAVHDYSNRRNSSSKALSRSDATVQIYAENRLLKTFKVPKDHPGNMWQVFKIDKNHVINPINSVTWIQDEQKMQ